MPNDPVNIEDFLCGLVDLLMAAGKSRAVNLILTLNEEPEWLCMYSNNDFRRWRLQLRADLQVMGLLEREPREQVQSDVQEQAALLMQSLPDDGLDDVRIVHQATARSSWREEAKTWLLGGGVSNQGRVRSDNPAPIEEDGLLFRSPPEVRLYKALKARGVTFAPLPVFIRGGRDYRRLEPDFIIIKDGIVYQIEVDGRTVHRESPADAQKRMAPMAFEGVEIHRIASSDIRDDDEAARRVDAIIKWIDKTKQNRR